MSYYGDSNYQKNDLLDIIVDFLKTKRAEVEDDLLPIKELTEVVDDAVDFYIESRD